MIESSTPPPTPTTNTMPSKTQPNTKPTGYALSAQNARTHELSAKTINLSPDEQTELTEILTGLESAYLPKGPIELHFCQEIAMSVLKQRRLWAYQALLEERAALRAEQQAIAPSYPDGTIAYEWQGSSYTIADEIKLLRSYGGQITRPQAEKLATEYIKFISKPAESPDMVQFGGLIDAYALRSTRTQAEAMQAIEHRIAHLEATSQRLQAIQLHQPKLQSAITIAEVPLSESIEKYQIRINRQLRLAIDQLVKLQEHRVLMAR